MKYFPRILDFTGLIICSYLIASVLYNTYNSDNIFAIFIYAGLGAMWLLFFYRTVKKDHRSSYGKYRLTKYLPSILSVLTLAPTLIIYQHYEKKINVPTLIQAQRHGVYADFKTDGTYIIKSGSWGSKIHFYGKYNLLDSIIEIDTSNIDEVLTSNRFLIKHANLEEEKHRPDYDRLNTDKYLVQIDKDGNEIKAREIFEETLPYKFEIVIDNRR